MKARRARAHFSVFDERGEESFAVERTADGTAQHDAGARAGNFGNLFWRPRWLRARRASPSRSLREPRVGAPERGEIVPDFAGEDLAVTRRLKKCQRFQSARAGAMAFQTSSTPQPAAAMMPSPVMTGNRAATRLARLACDERRQRADGLERRAGLPQCL